MDALCFLALIAGFSPAVLSRCFIADVWVVAPNVVVVVGIALGGALAVWYYRESAMLQQRRALRALTALAEDVVAAGTPSEIARSVSAVVPAALNATSVGVHLYDQAAQELRTVLLDGGLDPNGVRVDSPVGTLMSAAALCFRNRALLAIPNTRRSPLLENESGNAPPAALFVPMLTRGEALGVVSLLFASERELGKEDQAAIQHVANQIATSLKLQEQQHVREQLLRSEKVAATAQLMSGVAGELRVPLQAIRNLAANQDGARPDATLTAIAWEADRAHGILQQLSAFTEQEPAAPEPVDTGQVLGALVEYRRHEWTARGLDWQPELPPQPVHALAVPRQLERVVLDLLVRAEAAVERSAGRMLRLGARAESSRAVLHIAFTCPHDETSADPESLLGPGLQVCGTVVESMGGALRVLAEGDCCRIEIELPGFAPHQPAPKPEQPPAPARTLTVLIVDPEPPVQRRLMSLLAERRHRAVPVGTAEEAMDMLHRLRFDLVMCGARLPGMNWAEFHNRTRGRVRRFVLLSDSLDSELARGFRPGEGTLLRRVPEPEELHRALADIETP